MRGAGDGAINGEVSKHLGMGKKRKWGIKKRIYGGRCMERGVWRGCMERGVWRGVYGGGRMERGVWRGCMEGTQYKAQEKRGNIEPRGRY